MTPETPPPNPYLRRIVARNAESGTSLAPRVAEPVPDLLEIEEIHPVAPATSAPRIERWVPIPPPVLPLPTALPTPPPLLPLPLSEPQVAVLVPPPLSPPPLEGVEQRVVLEPAPQPISEATLEPPAVVVRPAPLDAPTPVDRPAVPELVPVDVPTPIEVLRVERVEERVHVEHDRERVLEREREIALARVDRLLRPDVVDRPVPPPPAADEGPRVSIGRVRVEVVHEPAPSPPARPPRPRSPGRTASLGAVPSKLRFGLGQV